MRFNVIRHPKLQFQQIAPVPQVRETLLAPINIAVVMLGLFSSATARSVAVKLIPLYKIFRTELGVKIVRMKISSWSTTVNLNPFIAAGAFARDARTSLDRHFAYVVL